MQRNAVKGPARNEIEVQRKARNGKRQAQRNAAHRMHRMGETEWTVYRCIHIRTSTDPDLYRPMGWSSARSLLLCYHQRAFAVALLSPWYQQRSRIMYTPIVMEVIEISRHGSEFASPANQIQTRLIVNRDRNIQTWLVVSRRIVSVCLFARRHRLMERRCLR